MHVHDDSLLPELLAPADPLDPLEVALPPLLVLLAATPLLLLESSVPPDPLEPDPPSSFDELLLLLQAASPAVDEAPITTMTLKSFSIFMTCFVPRRTAAGRVRSGTRGIRGGKPTTSAANAAGHPPGGSLPEPCERFVVCQRLRCCSFSRHAILLRPARRSSSAHQERPRILDGARRAGRSVTIE
jgi:hypothetical protein